MAAAAPDYQGIGTAFVSHYYNLFDTSRASLAPLYVRSWPLPPVGGGHDGIQLGVLGRLWSAVVGSFVLPTGGGGCFQY